jgi:hypothetical protein
MSGAVLFTTTFLRGFRISWFTVGIQNLFIFLPVFTLHKSRLSDLFQRLSRIINLQFKAVFMCFLPYINKMQSEHTIITAPHIVKKNIGKKYKIFA